MSSRFGTVLREFLTSAEDFRVVYNTLPRAKTVLVLDSLFNPPHLAHLNLVEQSLQRAPPGLAIMMLLSVQNADKAPAPASFDQRLDMMYLMSQWLEKKYPQLAVSIAVTTHAKFVDKATAIGRPGLQFLVGFDTLVRLVDAKYYAGRDVASVLRPFFAQNRVFCLTRTLETSIESQQKVVDDLNREYGEVIDMVCDESVGTVCSSNVRRERAKGTEEWTDWVIPEVADYIRANKLYLE